MTGERPIGDDDLQALVDGRLASERRGEVDAYLAANPVAGDRVRAYAAQREHLRQRLAFKAAEPIPSRLRIAAVRAERRGRALRRVRAAATAALWLAAGAAFGWSANAWRGEPLPAPAHRGGATIASEALGAHRIYAVEVVHPVEVGAAQEQHLVQWLSKRLARPLRAPDLGRFGYRLMGGRLLPAREGPAAQFMYEDDKGQRLTLYLRADADSETAFRFEPGGDASAFYWVDGGLGYALAAPLERDRLLALARAVYEQVEARASGPGAL